MANTDRLVALFLCVVCIASVASAAGAVDGEARRLPAAPLVHNHHRVNFREVFEFNLMSMIPEPAREFICLFAGCPNLAVLQSLSVRSSDEIAAAHAGNFSTEQDLLVVMTSTVGIPTVVLSFFKNAVDFKRGNWDEALARALITGDFKGVVDMKDSSFAMGTVFDSIIEYEDVDGDFAYTPQVDRVRSTYPLANSEWGAMTSSQRVDIANNDTVVSLNATTLDGVFSLQFNIASASVQVNRITSLNPNSTKIDVKIKGFPYSQEGTDAGNSSLALKTIVLSASAHLKLKIKNAHVMVGDEGYFDWVDVADVHGETVAVGSAFDPTPTAAASDLSGTILQLIMDVDSIAKSSDTMSTVYMSFNATNPSEVYWDPSVGYDFAAHTGGGNGGNPPPESWLDAHKWLVVGVGAAVVVTLVAAGVATTLHLRRRRRAEFPPLVPSGSREAAA